MPKNGVFCSTFRKGSFRKTMIFDLLTLFPDMCRSPFADSILGKALGRGLIRISAHNLRDWAEGRHRVTDDTPYGGGDGMVLKPEPVARALAELKSLSPPAKVLLMTPQGRPFQQRDAVRLVAEKRLVFVCGRYEGFDERIRFMVDEEFSLGDFVLTGGELAAMVMVDAIARLVPGVLGSSGSAESDSFSDGLLEYPHYTRPAEFQGMKVPEVLMSGNHAAIDRWRRREQLRRTLRRRPDLLDTARLSHEDLALLEAIKREESQ
jgi:tRNA (guanine37-N1)-methyltransferase